MELTPWRSLNLQMVWPSSFHSVAGPGEIAVRVGRQVVKQVERDADVVRRRAVVGVELEMSPPWAVTSLLLLGGLACAAPGSAWGSAPATPSAAAP